VTSNRAIIFEFQDYKAYLSAWMKSRPGAGRGDKTRIAQASRCQLAYVSRVLNGAAHFSTEQAAALNELLEHTEDEADYFLLLVQRARAGTSVLQKYYDRKIQKALDLRLILKNRLTDKKTLTREDQAIYYSDWLYSAVHLAVLVPRLRTPQSIANYLGASVEKIVRSLEFLEAVNLVIKKEREYFPGNTRIHLESDSPMISKHHTNWRLQAIRSLERTSPSELHYSSVIGISQGDLPRVREVMVKAIEEIRSVVRNSKDESVYCYSMDLFALGKEGI